MMKHIQRTALLALVVLFSLPAMAQEESPQKLQSIFQVLSLMEPGKGVITIHQPDYVADMVGRRPSSFLNAADGTVGVFTSSAKTAGYRVQVFSGNQRNSKGIATSRERVIREKFPMLPTYVDYQAPFWKLRVGNYLTRDEAEAALSELREEFPSFSKEMYVVKDAIYLL